MSAETPGGGAAAQSADVAAPPTGERRRARTLQGVGLLSGFTAGAWLGAAEAPTKLVSIGVSPAVISLLMVVGVFLARWSVPALLQGTVRVGADMRRAPHLIVWAVLAGALWAVANTLTVFAIRDIGLSIAFPLWNANSLLGIAWGWVFFNELRDAGPRRWLGVIGGAVVMFIGGTLLALASSTQAPGGHALRGVIAALMAGALWGTMYIPYRKAYLTGMSPLSFIAFFTIGEVVTMTALALALSGGVAGLVAQIHAAKDVLFWILLGGFVWVVGDLFQQYAAKYVGISRGIPLSNTNQLWGLLWGVLVFGELRGGEHGALGRVVAGSLLMAAGAAAIALSTAGRGERRRWREAAERESRRYGVDPEWTLARMEGEPEPGSRRHRRSLLDVVLVLIASAVFVATGLQARTPSLPLHPLPALLLLAAMAGLLLVTGLALWRATRFE